MRRPPQVPLCQEPAWYIRSVFCCGCSSSDPSSKETRYMPPTQRSLRVLLNTAAVWELLD